MRHAVTLACLAAIAAGGCDAAPLETDAGLDAAGRDAGSLHDAGRDAGPSRPEDGSAGLDTGTAADSGNGPDAALAGDAAMDAGALDDAAAPIDAWASPDAAVVLPPATCGVASVTGYSPPPGGGTCGYGPVAAHMPALFASGYTIAAAELFYGFPAAQGGGSRAEGEGCGECMEITVGDETTVVMITDVCDPGCCANCPHGAPSLDVAPGPHGDLRTANAGSTLGSVRVVPCPGAGTMRVYVDPLTQAGYTRLLVYSHAIALETVEIRGAGPGVSATNPWTPLTRTWTNRLELTGTDPRRGGTGVELRATSIHGEALASSVLVPLDDGADLDLGIQFHDLRAAGMMCAYEPLRSIYVDAFSSTVFSGFGAEAWRDTGSYSATVNLASTAVCHAGSACVSVAYLPFGGFAFGSNQLIPLADAPRLDLWARVAAGTPPTLRLQPVAADGVTCTALTLPTITSSWTHVTLDLTASCPAGARLSRFTIQNGAGNATVAFDDLQLLPP